MANEQTTAAAGQAQSSGSEPVRPDGDAAVAVTDSMSQPAVGTLLVDSRNGRVGVVMSHEGPYVQLRPTLGGREGIVSMSPRHAGSSLLEALPQASDAVLPGFGIAMRSEPASVEVARRVTRAWARYCRLPGDLVDAFLIVVSELCTNAVLHGRCDVFEVRGWMPAAGKLRLEVHDRTPSEIPEPQQPGAGVESGRGLLLVDALVTEFGGLWGFTEDGACAWCTFSLPGQGR